MAETASVPAKVTNGKSLARWDPFDMFDSLQEEITRLWGQPWATPGWPPLTRPLRRMAAMPSTWAPRVDVYEKGGALVVKAELPGIKKEDVAVTLEDGDLVIRGERKQEKEIKEEDYYRMERSFGSFYRRMALPFEVKSEQIKATFTDGVLEIQVPKPAQEQPKAAKIQVS